MKKLRAAVIGVGYLGRFHAEKYHAIEGVELVGVADADPARASETAKKVNTEAFSDPARLLGKIDAVSIVVPTALHHRVAKPFLENGIHVLLEKPISVTLAEADELIGLADRHGSILQIGHIERFNPAFTSVRTKIKSPRYITTERSAPFTVRCTDVNVILDLMIHDLDIAATLAGSEPKEVSAVGASVITKEIDIASARIVFANGCIADLSASRVSQEKKRLLRVLEGENIYHSDYQTQKAAVSGRSGNGIPELTISDIPTERCDTLNEEIRAFVESIRGGGKPKVSGREGRQALGLAAMITENIERGIAGFVPVG